MLPGAAPSKMFMPGYRDRHWIMGKGPLPEIGLSKQACPIPVLTIISNRMLVLFEAT